MHSAATICTHFNASRPPQMNCGQSRVGLTFCTQRRTEELSGTAVPVSAALLLPLSLCMCVVLSPARRACNAALSRFCSLGLAAKCEWTLLAAAMRITSFKGKWEHFTLHTHIRLAASVYVCVCECMLGNERLSSEALMMIRHRHCPNHRQYGKHYNSLFV